MVGGARGSGETRWPPLQSPCPEPRIDAIGCCCCDRAMWNCVPTAEQRRSLPVFSRWSAPFAWGQLACEAPPSVRGGRETAVCAKFHIPVWREGPHTALSLWGDRSNRAAIAIPM
jgi:hypothetical protein